MRDEAIVGFGRCDLRYATGSTLDWPVMDSSPRKADISAYPTLTAGFSALQAEQGRLGKFKAGKVRLGIKRVADVDVGALGTLIRASVAAMACRRTHPETPE